MQIVVENISKEEKAQLFEVLENYFGPYSSDKIESLMLKNKIAVPTGEYKMQVSKGMNPPTQKIIKMMASYGINIIPHVKIDVKKLKNLLSEENFNKLNIK